jgi:hypothetical protein
MPWVGFELTIPAYERTKTVHILGREVTVIGNFHTYSSKRSQPRYERVLEWRGQLHSKTDLFLGKSSLCSLNGRLGRAPEPVWRGCGREEFLSLPGIEFESSNPWSVTILTELSRFLLTLLLYFTFSSESFAVSKNKINSSQDIVRNRSSGILIYTHEHFTPYTHYAKNWTWEVEMGWFSFWVCLRESLEIENTHQGLGYRDWINY